MWIYIEEAKEFLYNFVVNYIDIDYSLWLTYLLMPLIITIVLPLMILFLIYTTVLIFYIYKLHWRALSTVDTSDFWGAARKIACIMWDAHGWIWHGYEIDGFENIPEEGPALIIYYHGSLPLDMYYLIAKVNLKRNRLLHTVTDNFLLKFPGFSLIADALKSVPGTRQSCTHELRSGNLLAIAPGGVYEAQFSSSTNYELLWKARLGFAKVALDAKVQVLPMFTENIKESFRTALFGSWGRRLFLRLYARYRFPIAPIYGGFPVKLITHIGKPVEYDPNSTPEEIQEKITAAIEELRDTHQRLPGSIMKALLDRIPYFRRKNKKKSM